MIGETAPPGPFTALAIVAGAGVIAAIAILLIRPLLVRFALAKPNARSSHVTPTPQGGGVAVVGAALAVAIAATLAIGSGGDSVPWQVFYAAVVLAVTGLADDLRSLPVSVRLIVQLAAVIAVIAALPADTRIAPILPWIVERMLLVIALAWFVNLVNFMDGIDWMTVAEVVPVSAALALAGALGLLPPPATVTALALLGAMIGFAPFNRPVARLFLGDSGSLPLGLLLGWLLILLAGNGHFAAAILLPLYYLADATITLERRRRNGERLWDAHRSHFYQRATANGFTVNQVVARVFGLNVALAGIALATIPFHSVAVHVTALAVGGALVGLLLRAFHRPTPNAEFKS